MKKLALRLAVALTLLAVGFVGGYWKSCQDSQKTIDELRAGIRAAQDDLRSHSPQPAPKPMY